jgi:multiple sugar transport system permease protein
MDAKTERDLRDSLLNIDKENKFTKNNLFRKLMLLVLIVIAAIMFFPLFWMIASSFKDKTQFYANPPVIIPIPLYFQNYINALFQINFLHTILNTFLYAGSLTIVTVISSTFVAFGFSRFKFFGRNVLFGILLATMMIPNQIMTIPMFIFYRNLGWLNSFYPLIVPNMFGVAYHIFLIRQFMNTISKEMDEAALLDGCGPFKLFYQIIIPLCKPVLIVSAIFNFFWAWKDVWYAGIYLQSTEMMTVSVRLVQFIGDRYIQYGELMAAGVMSVIPLVIIYFACQKYFDQGIAISESK